MKPIDRNRKERIPSDKKNLSDFIFTGDIVLTAREKLLSFENVYDQEGTSEVFMEAMRECLQHHIDHNTFFKNYMEKSNFQPGMLKTEEDLKKIPFMHANFFKKYEVLSIDRKDVYEHVTSSGTSWQ